MDELDGFLLDGLPDLLRVLRSSDVCELEVQGGDLRVRLHRSAVQRVEGPAEEAQEAEAPPPLEPRVVEITAPLVGTFYRAHEPGMPPLVESGSHVADDTLVGIVEALQVLTEVPAGCRGTVTNVLATDGQPVGYGQALFEVTLDG